MLKKILFVGLRIEIKILSAVGERKNHCILVGNAVYYV